MLDIQQRCVQSYRKHQHLVTVGKELGIPWATVYWHLRKANEPVTGNKLHHGSATDKFGAKAEALFKRLVPYANDLNGRKFQAPYDFEVNGAKVEIKAARKDRNSWCFSLKRQSSLADFFVCFGFSEDRAEVVSCFVFPFELVSGMQTLRVSKNGKWSGFEVKTSDLKDFFANLKESA